MKHKGYTWGEEPLELTDEEKIMHQDYLDNPGAARPAIWKYAYNDMLIPNELKPILLEILKKNYKGKPKAETAAYWITIVREIAFLAVEEGISQDAALAKIAAKRGEKIETVQRRYRSAKYSKMKDAILHRET